MWTFVAYADRLARRAAWLAMASSIALGSCEGCTEPGAATLVSHRGSVHRQRVEQPGARWEPADDGAQFEIGDGVRTEAGATALLRLRGGAIVRLMEQTEVRFHLPGEASERSIDVRAGEAMVEAEEQVALRTVFGDAILEPGTRALLRGGEEPRFTVVVGHATMDGAEGLVELMAGRSLAVAIGRAEVEDARRFGSGSASPDSAPSSVTLTVRGRGASWWPAGAQAWMELPEGEHTVTPGARLALEPGSRVTARRGEGRIDLSGMGRAIVGGEEEPILTATAGELDLDGRRDEVALRVPGGVITATFDRARGGSRARVAIDVGGAVVQATEGRVRIWDGARDAWLDIGEALTLTSDASDRPPYGPVRADLWVRAGETFWVHAPRVPVVVGLSALDCAGEAVVETDDHGARGMGRVGIALPTGRHDYVLRCVGLDGSVAEEPTARGRIRVVEDSGRSPVPLRPPENVVEVDGRRYTLLYQNLPPRIVVKWAAPFTRGPYTLTLNGDERRARRSPRPRFELPSGVLREGTHVLAVHAADGRRSQETSVVVRFDNAAPTASVRRPIDGAFSAGDRVEVAGVVQRGWRVRAEGESLSLDDQYRFRGAVTAPTQRNALAIRLSHPERGVHYYLRWTREASR